MKDSISPFSISIPQDQLDDLSARLSGIRWPDAETVGDNSQGLPLAYAKELATYWEQHYDWRRCERVMNDRDQFTTVIDDIEIHFHHIKSPHPSARPLLITHGWPGSTVEFLKVIEPLTHPTDHSGTESDAFHLVIPSLPGFGFSGKPKQAGVGIEAIARMWAKLMSRLGYGHYLAQGGDWGAVVTEALAATDPAHCNGIHLNLLIAVPSGEDLQSMTAEEQQWLADIQSFDALETGYSRQQATRPQTIGYGLADSPVGQMAWIVEKFWSWVDFEKDGAAKLEQVLSKDELLDNVMMYWLNNAATSSARLYWESYGKINRESIDVPVGCSAFPGDMPSPGRRLMSKRFTNIIYWNELPKGGHFAAFEQPELYVTELRRCFEGFLGQ